MFKKLLSTTYKRAESSKVIQTICSSVAPISMKPINISDTVWYFRKSVNTVLW